MPLTDSGGGQGPFRPCSNSPYRFLQPDLDDAVVPSQLHTAAELYYFYQHERLQNLEVVETLLRLLRLLQLLRLGKARLQRGSDAYDPGPKRNSSWPP